MDAIAAEDANVVAQLLAMDKLQLEEVSTFYHSTLDRAHLTAGCVQRTAVWAA